MCEIGEASQGAYYRAIAAELECSFGTEIDTSFTAFTSEGFCAYSGLDFRRL